MRSSSETPENPIFLMATKSNPLQVGSQIISTSPVNGANFRAQGTYGATWSCEGNSTYFGVTTSNNPTGSRNYNFLVGNNQNGFITATQGLYGAWWNDFADIVPCQKDLNPIPGMCYCYDHEIPGFRLPNEDGDPAFMGICTDTFGVATGTKLQEGLEEDRERHFSDTEVPENEIALSVAGFCLAYIEFDKVYPTGTPLMVGEFGALKPATDDIPSWKIVALYWKPEPKEVWYGKEVNGRHWVKVVR